MQLLVIKIRVTFITLPTFAAVIGFLVMDLPVFSKVRSVGETLDT